MTEKSNKPPKYRLAKRNPNMILTYDGIHSVCVVTMRKGYEHLTSKILDLLNKEEK